MTKVLKIEYTKNSGGTGTIVIPYPKEDLRMTKDIRSGEAKLAAVIDDFLAIKSAYYDTTDKEIIHDEV